jgi:hypothetical protein
MRFMGFSRFAFLRSLSMRNDAAVEKTDSAMVASRQEPFHAQSFVDCCRSRHSDFFDPRRASAVRDKRGYVGKMVDPALVYHTRGASPATHLLVLELRSRLRHFDERRESCTHRTVESSAQRSKKRLLPVRRLDL